MVQASTNLPESGCGLQAEPARSTLSGMPLRGIAGSAYAACDAVASGNPDSDSAYSGNTSSGSADSGNPDSDDLALECVGADALCKYVLAPLLGGEQAVIAIVAAAGDFGSGHIIPR